MRNGYLPRLRQGNQHETFHCMPWCAFAATALRLPLMDASFAVSRKVEASDKKVGAPLPPQRSAAYRAR